MSKLNNLSDFLTDLANAIRAKKGTSGAISAQNFATEIANIVTSLPGQTVIVTPNGSQQIILPDAGHTLDKVIVAAMSDVQNEVDVILNGTYGILTDEVCSKIMNGTYSYAE